MMEDPYYTPPPESYDHAPAVDPPQTKSDQSWYRHSGQTGEYSSGRSASPNGTHSISTSASDRKRSSLDPRRITPTLHASLVSEILTLRRDLESKTASIYDLESSLQDSKLELQSVEQQLRHTARDRSTNRRQADDAEKHLYQVTEDLIRERDEAVSAGQDLRTRLNTLTAKGRRQEQEFEKWQRDYEQRTLSWESERRNLEHRLHTTENQLRMVVDEVQTRRPFKSSRSYSASSSGRPSANSPGQAIAESPFASPGPGRRPQHKRNISILSNESEGILVGTPPRDFAHVQRAGKTLAEELDSDADLDEEEEADVGGPQTAASRLDHTQPIETPTKARKVLGMDHSRSKDDAFSPMPSLAKRTIQIDAGKQTIESPAPRPNSRSALPEYAQTLGRPPSRRRQEGSDYFGSMNNAIISERGATPRIVYMTSSAATQTNAPAQQLVPQAAGEPSRARKPNLTIVYLGTQIAVEPQAADDSDIRPSTPQSQPLAVPAIAVHPPSSAPTSPRRLMLPPNSVNAACQTDSRMPSRMVHASIQTEEIRIDARRFRAHLLPEPTPTSSLETMNPVKDDRHLSYQSTLSQDTIQSVSVQEITESLETKAIKETVQRSLARSLDFRENAVGQRDSRNLRTSFWGGQSADTNSMLLSLQDEPGIKSGQSSMLARELRKSALSDASTNIETYMLPSKETPRNSRDLRELNVEAPQDQEDEILEEPKRVSAQGIIGLRTSFRSRASSGATANSSVFSSASQPPPIPVPHRSSSRVHSDLLEEAKAALSYDGSPKKRQPHDMAGSRPRGVRKARSSNSIRRTNQSSPKARRRTANRLAPIHSMAFENDLEDIESAYEVHTPTVAAPGPYADSRASPGSPDTNLDTPLVDAIASAMVGEWMWKYAQKRKSFGMADSGKEFTVDDRKDNTRQKRWIWLSPYERTIMWSSKQPLSGSALMGKAGRKLHIKTVLDVKDDNPLPKGSNYATCYERSIVILTPDRPLKITAASRDRHYFWLMALSFLANPSQGPPQIPRLPSHAVLNDKRESQQLEHKDSVIEQSISKATAQQTRSFTDPSMSSFHNANHLHPYNEYNRTVVGGPTSSTSTAIYSHPDMPDVVTDKTSLRKFRRGSTSQQSLQAHSRRRSNTNPIRLPTAITALMTSNSSVEPVKHAALASRRDPTSSPKPIVSEQPGSQRNPGMIRMTAFVDPSYQDPYAPPIPSPHMAPSIRSQNSGPSGPRTPLMPSNEGQFTLGPAGLARSPVLSSTRNAASERPVSPLLQQTRPFSPGIFKGLKGKKKKDDGEASLAGSTNTDDRRRLGYVFDDQGMDPFRGF